MTASSENTEYPKTGDRKPTILLIGLGYGYLRLLYELAVNLAESSALYYLVGILIGLHALQFWIKKTRAAGQTPTSAVTTSQAIVLTILVVALVMDAGRLLITLTS